MIQEPSEWDAALLSEMQPSFSAVAFPEARGEEKLKKNMDVYKIQYWIFSKYLFKKYF